MKFDCGGALIAPGFIDVQINGIIFYFVVCFSSVNHNSNILLLGGFGVDFSQDDDNIEVGLEVVAKGILAYGTTSFCPTLVTSSPEFYNKVYIHLIIL